MTLSRMKADFQAGYRTLIKNLLALSRPLLVCTIYDHVPGLPPELVTALGVFNDVILREAIRHRLPVLDLRMICTEHSDYSVASPIEPSSQGGEKIASRIVTTIVQHDSAATCCHVYQ